jgi:hypothetical protein
MEAAKFRQKKYLEMDIWQEKGDIRKRAKFIKDTKTRANLK